MLAANLGLLLACVLCVSCATLVPVAPMGCERNGVHYKPGDSFQPSPCEHCHCGMGGRVICAIADCFFTDCVDSVHDPTKCCPVCPNGPNCKHTDGTIIKQGEQYKPDPYTTCECPQNMFGMRGTMAICAVQAQTVPVPVAPVDPIINR